MLSDTNGKRTIKSGLYWLAGLATAPHFMAKARTELDSLLQRHGHAVRSELLFPYGDWSRSVVPQLWEIRRDMRLRENRIQQSIGGNRALQGMLLPEAFAAGEQLTVLLGHSGGGVAAVHAAQLLQQHRSGHCLVVMIGAPRCRIPERLRSSVLSIRAGQGRDRNDKPRDFVSRLGSHGGWITGARGFPAWRPDMYAPGASVLVPLIGGHADYFRDSDAYKDLEGRSNLELTMEVIRTWLFPRIDEVL